MPIPHSRTEAYRAAPIGPTREARTYADGCRQVLGLAGTHNAHTYTVAGQFRIPTGFPCGDSEHEHTSCVGRRTHPHMLCREVRSFARMIYCVPGVGRDLRPPGTALRARHPPRPRGRRGRRRWRSGPWAKLTPTPARVAAGRPTLTATPSTGPRGSYGHGGVSSPGPRRRGRAGVAPYPRTVPPSPGSTRQRQRSRYSSTVNAHSVTPGTGSQSRSGARTKPSRA